jgi:SAM-dependent methyltransferase
MPAAGRRRVAPRLTLASRADPYDLYQRSVQSPEAMVEFFDRTYRRLRRRRPLRLREDFCGTALLSTEWARSHPRRSAVAVDIDPGPLAWGRAHNLGPAGPEVAGRVELVRADVRTVRTGPVDIACAMNFSFCTFRERRVLRRYLERARRALAPGGLFLTELYGGTEAIVALEEKRRVGAFTYVWEQESFNPIDHRTRCHIHFRFRDGSEIRRAFSYDWRLWSIVELRELLGDAGFAATEVHWDAVEDGRDTGAYRQTEEEENQEGWLVYVVGVT